MGKHLRTVALIAAGGLGVHQLRYLAAHGDGASFALAREGHGYLPFAFAASAFLFAAGLLALLLALASRRSHVATPRTLARRWVAASLAVAAVYTCQELAEGALAGGHPDGVAAVLGSGGWLALPLAAAAGLAIALLQKGAQALLESGGRPRHRRRVRPLTISRPSTPLLPPPVGGVLSRHLAGRAPPPLPHTATS